MLTLASAPAGNLVLGRALPIRPVAEILKVHDAGLTVRLDDAFPDVADQARRTGRARRASVFSWKGPAPAAPKQFGWRASQIVLGQLPLALKPWLCSNYSNWPISRRQRWA